MVSLFAMVLVTGYGIFVLVFPVMFLMCQQLGIGPHYDQLFPTPMLILLFLWSAYHTLDQVDFRLRHQIWPWIPLSLARLSLHEGRDGAD